MSCGHAAVLAVLPGVSPASKGAGQQERHAGGDRVGPQPPPRAAGQTPKGPGHGDGREHMGQGEHKRQPGTGMLRPQAVTAVTCVAVVLL